MKLKSLWSYKGVPLWQLAWKRFRKLFYLDQWVLLISDKQDFTKLNWEKWKVLTPPKDRFWADPFIWEHEGKNYIFAEEAFYSNNRGRIICITLTASLDVESIQIVLEQPYHLSYPFIFEYQRQLYMLPETRQNNRLELYRCVRFPSEWQLEKVLMDKIHALDPTLLEYNGTWWLFTHIPQENGKKWDTLHLFYADSPLSTKWNPHPMNPIIRNVHSARPAGRIFELNGNLIRPGQDCSKRYGYGVCFNEIKKLTREKYLEIPIFRFAPKQLGNIQATHTFTKAMRITVIDAIYRRKRPF